jgi:hypothetical protein
VPNLSRAWDNVLAKVVFDHWQISELLALSGAQGGFTYIYSGAPTGTLSGNGSVSGGANRPDIVCDPRLPSRERTFERQFRTECIARQAISITGNAPGDEFHGPIRELDISAFKHFPLGGTRRLQLRVELYNAFNTDQWTGVNTNAQFNYTTRALANLKEFGALTGATNSARRIQLGARFTF